MAKKDKHDHDEFYEELDKHKHRPSFSCTSLVVMLLFFFLSGSYLVYWSITQIRARVITPKTSISNYSLANAEAKLQNFLKGQTAAPSQPVVLSLTDEELTSLLVKSEILSQDAKYSIKDPSAQISPTSVMLFGALTKPIQSRLVVETIPEINNGQLVLKVQSVKAGKLVVPALLRRGVDNLFNRLVTSRLNSNNLVYETVTLGDHVITLTGHSR
jgi:hypothetical protein